MPITEKEMTFAEMRQHESPAFFCAECGGRLNTAWGGTFGIPSYILRCGKDVNHKAIARRYEPSAYELPDEANPFNLTRGRREKMEKELGKEKTDALIEYAGTGSLTQKEANLILRTIWPEAPAVEVGKAALICHMYKLNPLMKHLFLLPFKNKTTGVTNWTTVLSIKASRILARRQGTFSYLDDTPRPMTEDEQKRRRGVVDPDNIWFITILRDKEGNVAPGYGCWSKQTAAYGTDKGNTRENMAAIRSERQAFDRLFPDALPASIEVVPEEFVSTVTVSDVAPEQIAKPEPLRKEQAVGVVPVSEAKPAGGIPSLAEPEPDPPLKNLGDFFTACADKRRFGMSKGQVLKELGYTDQSQIGDLAVAYQQIKAIVEAAKSDYSPALKGGASIPPSGKAL